MSFADMQKELNENQMSASAPAPQPKITAPKAVAPMSYADMQKELKANGGVPAEEQPNRSPMYGAIAAGVLAPELEPFSSMGGAAVGSLVHDAMNKTDLMTALKNAGEEGALTYAGGKLGEKVISPALSQLGKLAGKIPVSMEGDTLGQFSADKVNALKNYLSTKFPGAMGMLQHPDIVGNPSLPKANPNTPEALAANAAAARESMLAKEKVVNASAAEARNSLDPDALRLAQTQHDIINNAIEKGAPNPSGRGPLDPSEINTLQSLRDQDFSIGAKPAVEGTPAIPNKYYPDQPTPAVPGIPANPGQPVSSLGKLRNAYDWLQDQINNRAYNPNPAKNSSSLNDAVSKQLRGSIANIFKQEPEYAAKMAPYAEMQRTLESPTAKALGEVESAPDVMRRSMNPQNVPERETLAKLAPEQLANQLKLQGAEDVNKSFNPWNWSKTGMVGGAVLGGAGLTAGNKGLQDLKTGNTLTGLGELGLGAGALLSPWATKQALYSLGTRGMIGSIAPAVAATPWLMDKSKQLLQGASQ